MKALNKILAAALALIAVSTGAYAQENSQSSAVMRRSDRDSRTKAQSGPQITQRMENFFEETPSSEADLAWMRVYTRHIDLNDDKNAPLYYPEDIIDGQENLFRIIMRLLANNQIPAYEYLDGREIFTDQYRVKTRDVLDRFHVLYKEAKGSTEKNPKFEIEEADVPTTEVLSYYAIERKEFDTRTNRVNTRIEAICPVLHRAGEWGGEAVRYPMFWVKMSDIRPYLAQQYIFTSDYNNLPNATYDDFFTLNMYKGDIVKTRNLRNRSLMQQYPDPEDFKRAQDSIENSLKGFEDKLWVPSREELMAQRDGKKDKEEVSSKVKSSDKVAAEDSEEVDSDSADAEKPKASTRSSRGKKKTSTAKKPKESKVKTSKSSTSSSAVRSVRRRR